MNNRSGLTFADVLILVAIVLLLAALAVPKFVKAPDFGNEEDEAVAETTTNTPAADDADTTTATNTSAIKITP